MRHYRTHSTTEPTHAGLSAARTRRAAGTAAIAVLALVLVGCGDLITAPQEPAYPRFSLTGDMPDRVDAFDVRVEGPDMDPIEEELTREDGEITFEVPAGRDRTFEVLARDDVYAARRTVSLAPGRETTLDMDVYPGPVFLDQNADPDLIQIRDLGIRNSDFTDTDLGRDYTTPDFEDVGYDDNGRLWVLSSPGSWFDPPSSVDLRFYSSWSQIENDRPEEVVSFETEFKPQTAAVHSDSRRVAVAANGNVEEGQTAGLNVFDFDGNEVEGDFDTEQEATSFSVDWRSGISFETRNRLWVLGRVNLVDDETGEIDFDSSYPAVVRYDADTGTIDYHTLPDDPVVFNYGSTPPWGDIKVVSDEVFVVAATYPEDVLDENDDPIASELNRADHPSVYRYNLDLELQETWGRRVASSNPVTKEFWGPRRFAASRREGELILIDQKDSGGLSEFDGTGRLLRFEFGSSEGWEEFGESDFGFFDTSEPN